MTYPRGTAMAEVIWSDTTARNYEDFSKRLTYHFKRLDALGVNTAQSFFDVEGEVTSENGQVKVVLNSKNDNAEIRYTLDGTAPTYKSIAYAEPFEITKTSDIQAVTFINGIQKGNIWKSQVHLHKAVDKPITIKNQPAKRYSGGGIATILNGIYGNDNHFGDTEWLGFEGQNFDGVIDLGEAMDISSVKCRFFKNNGAWIYLPKKMSVYTSIDGENYKLAGETTEISTATKVAQPVVKFNAKARFVKVVVDRLGIIPEGLTGGGYEAWLFVGELEVQ
jgi:hexosaminidase